MCECVCAPYKVSYTGMYRHPEAPSSFDSYEVILVQFIPSLVVVSYVEFKCNVSVIVSEICLGDSEGGVNAP